MGVESKEIWVVLSRIEVSGFALERVRDVAPVLLALPGCGELTAAKLVGEAGGVTRFKSEAAFARHAGVAPVPVWVR